MHVSASRFPALNSNTDSIMYNIHRCVLIVLAGTTPSALAQATFTGLGVLPGFTNSYAQHLSADGLTVSGSCSDGQSSIHAFLWKNGVMQDIGIPPGGNYSQGGPLNPDGTILIGEIGPTQRPARWTQATGVLVDLGLPTTANFVTSSVSADGSTIWGYGGSSPITPRVYTWTAATGVQFFALPANSTASYGGDASADGTVVAGSAMISGSMRPVRWVNGVPVPITLPGGFTQGDGIAISADGLVITGSITDTGNVRRVLRWTAAGGVQNLGGTFGGGREINSDGSVIVGWQAPLGWNRAFFWTSATGIVDLETHLLSLGVNLDGWTIEAAQGVSADGRTILGQGTHNGVTEGFLVRLPQACYANCDGSTGTPRLTAGDFQCFINIFAAADSRANCDGSTVAPVLTANDFMCFINKFAGGCS